MRRRAFIALVGGAVAAWPFAVRAQEPDRTYRIGFVTPSSRESYGVLFDELRLNGFSPGTTACASASYANYTRHRHNGGHGWRRAS
jgi:hypothetical protein